MTYPLLPRLFRGYLRRELPAWGRLYEWLGLGGIDNVNPRWRQGPVLTARGKLHGYLMELDLRDDQERWVYFLGRYYDLELQLLLDAILRPGDTFIDVGANIGMMTLFAASRVGPSGRVIAFEPQPGCCAKLRRNLELNGIGHVELHNLGLADRDDSLTLKVLGGGSIMSAFSIDEQLERTSVREEIAVPVRRGDAIVGDRIVGSPMLKVDVEGFELFVLRGLEGFIGRDRPPILIEIEPRYLRRAGVDEHQLFAFFRDRDYLGYTVSLGDSRRRRTFRLRPVPTPEDLRGEIDVLWLPARGGRFDPSPYLIGPPHPDASRPGGPPG